MPDATMELHNEDQPGDDAITLEKKRWRRGQIARMSSYQQSMMTIAGVDMPLDIKPDFYTAANKDSVSFLTKLVSDVWSFTDPDLKRELVSAVYENHFIVVYKPATGPNTEGFFVPDMKMDYLDSNKTRAEQAVLEKVKAAMLLAHTAKARGWKNVNFGGTQDPLSRYALKMACQELGLNSSSETIDYNKIPTNPAMKESLMDTAHKLFKALQDDPNLTVANPQYHKNDNDNHKRQPEQPAATAAATADDPFNFEEEPPQPRAA